MKIGILAVQGAFAEHKSKLEKLGARCMELRKKEDLDGDFDGLVCQAGRVRYRENSFGSWKCLSL